MKGTDADPPPVFIIFTGPYSRQLPVKLCLFGDKILQDEDEHDKESLLNAFANSPFLNEG